MVNYSLCKAKPPWPHSCHHLLDGIAMKIIMWIIGSVALILNIFSLIASIYKIIKSLQPNNNNKGKVYIVRPDFSPFILL